MRRSNREPCSQHSIVQPSTSPSESETLACEQVSSTAWMPPSSSRHDGDALAVDGHQDRAHLRERVDLERALVAHWAAASRALGAPIEVSSSSSISRSSRSSISGTPICCTSSTKNPRTTNRRASSSGMPRACR